MISEAPRILIADDNENTLKLIALLVQEMGCEPLCASNGRMALELFEQKQPHLAVIDIMMPLVDGFEVCERIRQSNATLPILLLSAKGDIVDKRVGFKSGADDYLTKPFVEEELRLRIGALLRRAQAASLPLVGVTEIGPFAFDSKNLSVTIDGRVISLTPKEYQILTLLASNAGRCFTADDIIKHIWGSEYLGEAVSIPVYIRRVRRKIERTPSKPEYIRTAWGSGYYFEARPNSP